MAQNPFTQVGWLELIHIHPDHRFHPFIAKLDTGAETSSIDARDIEKFEKDGKKWIKLNLIDHNAKLFPYEAPLIRSVSIKRHGGKPLSREVITIPISRFGRTFAVEFSLADRSAFEYRVLLGTSSSFSSSPSISSFSFSFSFAFNFFPFSSSYLTRQKFFVRSKMVS